MSKRKKAIAFTKDNRICPLRWKSKTEIPDDRIPELICMYWNTKTLKCERVTRSQCMNWNKEEYEKYQSSLKSKGGKIDDTKKESPEEAGSEATEPDQGTGST
jgi:hypothetical protein